MEQHNSTEEATDGPVDLGREVSILSRVVIGFSLYFIGLSGWRLHEIGSLPGDVVIHPDFPPWLLGYLTTMIISLLLLGSFLLCAGVLLLKRKLLSGLFFVLFAVGTIVWIGIHGYFLFKYDKAVSQGGLIWGIIHTITLTRIHDPAGATSAGLAGYNAGRVCALLGMLTVPAVALLFGLKLLNDRSRFWDSYVI